MAYQGAEYWVGSHKLLKDYQANLSDILADMLTQYESDGNSIVYFGRENDLLAVIAIKDQLRVTCVCWLPARVADWEKSICPPCSPALPLCRER